MIESGYYPPGAEFDPSAPWNEPGPPDEKTFDVCISQTLSRDTTVTTSDYSVDVDCDEDGYYQSIDTSETNWKEAAQGERMTPLELIGEFNLSDSPSSFLRPALQRYLIALPIEKQ